MKYSFTLFFCLLFLLPVGLQAQQPAQYSLYMLNKYAFNPAYAGLDNSLSVNGVYRKQWVNLEGSPVTQNVNAHLPLYFLGGGIGINLENDLIGAERNTAASLSYNYFLPVSKKSVMSFGISAGVIQKTLDGTKLRTPEGLYTEPPVIDHQDELVPLTKVSGAAPTVNVGVYFQSEQFEAGLSVLNVTEPTVALDATQSLKYTIVRNYFLNLAYDFDISQRISLRPSILAKSDLVQTQIELSLLLDYNDNIFGGASFRGYNNQSIDAFVFFAGYKLSERVTLAYSYDLTLSGLNTVSQGSHEVMINYNLGKPIGKGKLPKIIYNPRFL